MKNSRRYYIHRRLKKHGLDVKARQRYVGYTMEFYNKLPSPIQNMINELASIGYNCQILIA